MATLRLVTKELEHHEVEKLVKRGAAAREAAQRAHHLISEMRKNFDGAEVTAWESIEGTFGLPDPDNEHVAAAAVIARAGAIVTENLKDFPAAQLPADLQVLPAAEFALNSVGVDPVASLRAAEAIAERSGRAGTNRTVGDVLTLLEARYGMTDAVSDPSPGRSRSGAVQVPWSAGVSGSR